MKNKAFWLMFFIVGLGTILRLIFIDKPDGLWNDEYVSWYIASIPLGKKFIDAVFAQCHMPLYYFYLKIFIHYFGNSDLMLRLTSVLPGVLSIFSMYFVGKEFKDKNLGILCASLTALSSFLIYFSQEVRFYELLFLFASLSLLFALRLIKKQNLSNIVFYVLSNLLILFTHTIGFIFVFLNMVFVSAYLSKNGKYKKIISTIWLSILLSSLAAFPLIFKILTTHSQTQWGGRFTLSKIGFFITDYFSPVLTNIVSSPDNFFYNFSFGFLVFAIIPSFIAIAGITRALIKETANREKESRSGEVEICKGAEEPHICASTHFAFSDSSPFTIHHSLFTICLVFILVLILAAIFGKLTFITKYSIEIYPILLLLVGFGLLRFPKNIRYVLIFMFCFLNLFYIITNPLATPKIRRSEGHKIVAELINHANLNSGDFILLTYYPKERFEKYFDFDKYNVISINKGNFSSYLGTSTKEDLNKIKKKYFETKFKEEILDKLKPGQKMVIVILKDVSIYSPTQMQVLMSNDKEYKKIPLLFLVFSYLKNEILEECLKTLQILRLEQKGSWSVITFLKR